MPNNLPEPNTRKETFLASAAGMEVETPTPITREEMYLDAIGKGGGSGDSYTKAETDQLLDGKADLVDGKIPAAQLPSYVDDVLEYASVSSFPATGESGKIYIAQDTNKTYRWGGSAYVEISESLALGETSSTAYPGNKGKANADAIAAIKDGTNIDSFADVETALADKADKSTTYTKGQVDAALAAKLNTADVDAALSSTSTNPVQNKAVYEAVAPLQANSIKLVYRNLPGEVSRTVTYQMATTDFTNAGNANFCGIYLIMVVNWSTTPSASVYIACYSGGAVAYHTLTKIGGADAQLTIDEDSVITYTGKGKIQIYALQ